MTGATMIEYRSSTKTIDLFSWPQKPRARTRFLLCVVDEAKFQLATTGTIDLTGIHFP